MNRAKNIEAESVRLNDEAATAWLNGDEQAALARVEDALKENPDNAFAFINRYYFNETIKAREKDKESRKNRRVEKVVEARTDSPKISVILPTYKRPEFLSEALGSVLNQTLRELEVVVVNDGGTPEAENICRGANDPRITYTVITHSGLSGALNAGLEIARGEYIAYLDDDDLFKPNHLEILFNELEKWGQIGVVYSDADKILGEKKTDGWVWSAPSPFYREDFSREKLIRQNFIHNQCALHPKKIAVKFGGYHEGIVFGVNWEMWLKLSAKYPFKRTPVSTVIYRDRKSDTMSVDPNRKRQHSRNVILYTHRLFTMNSSVLPKSKRLGKELSRLLKLEPSIIDTLDFRELLAGKPYALFFNLGKNLEQAGEIEIARQAYKSAIRLAPWELKSLSKLLSLKRNK